VRSATRISCDNAKQGEQQAIPDQYDKWWKRPWSSVPGTPIWAMDRQALTQNDTPPRWGSTISWGDATWEFGKDEALDKKLINFVTTWRVINPITLMAVTGIAARGMPKLGDLTQVEIESTRRADHWKSSDPRRKECGAELAQTFHWARGRAHAATLIM
jgi:hypothetical protein